LQENWPGCRNCGRARWFAQFLQRFARDIDMGHAGALQFFHRFDRFVDDISQLSHNLTMSSGTGAVNSMNCCVRGCVKPSL